MKRLIIFITSIIIIFISYLIIIFLPKNYEVKYKLKDIVITESYHKKESSYVFHFKYKNVNFPLVINKKYTRKRNLIKNIKVMELNNEKCLNLKIDNNNYYLCSKDDILIDKSLLSAEFKEKYNVQIKKDKKLDEYSKISIYDNNNYLIWNYKGFIDIKNKKEYNILTTDNYTNELAYQTSNYFIFPNYDSKYFFNKIYIYNINNQKLEEMSFEFDISYESYYLGNIKEKIYLLDKKNKKEYLIDLKKKNIEIIGDEFKGIQIYEENEFSTYKINKVITNSLKFTTNISNQEFNLEKNILYMKINNIKIQLLNEKVDKIVLQKNQSVYYLIDDILYKYDQIGGHKKILQYKEWKFNNSNQIFIFN